MSKTIRRKNAYKRFKDHYVTKVENITVINGVFFERVGWICGLVKMFHRQRSMACKTAEEYHAYEEAWFHSDKLFNHPSDTYLRKCLNKQHRLESKRQLRKAIREASEDNLSLMRKKVISGWMD